MRFKITIFNAFFLPNLLGAFGNPIDSPTFHTEHSLSINYGNDCSAFEGISINCRSGSVFWAFPRIAIFGRSALFVLLRFLWLSLCLCVAMIAQIHQWNAYICLLLGICFNSLLIWLLIFRSTKEMRMYSRILLQTAVVDIVLALSNALVQPVLFSCPIFPFDSLPFSVFFIHDNSGVIYLNGPWMPSISSSGVRFLLLVAWILLIDFSVHGLCVQFYVRYLQIVRERQISLLRYVALLLLLLLFDLGLCGLFSHAASNSKSDALYNEQIAQLLSVDTSPAIYVTVNAVSSDTGHATSAYGLLLGAFCYSVIIASGYKTMKIVRANALSGKSWGQQQIVNLNKQITRSLIILAIMPLALNFIHIAFALAVVVYSNKVEEEGTSTTMLYIQMLALLPTHWLTVLNPLGTIFTVKPFWRAVINPLKNCVSPAQSSNN